MPNILDPNSISMDELKDMSFDYDYPIDEDLSPGSDLHEEVKRKVLKRARESREVMQRKYSDWRETDKVLKAYVPPKQLRDGEDKGRTEKKFVMPVSYANLETLLTYMSAAFISDPIFTYEGTGPEDVLGAQLLTKVVSQHARRMKLSLAMHTMWRDAFAYGIGPASPQWHRKMGRKTMVEEVGLMSRMRNMFISTGQERVTSEYQVLWEGNKLVNIDPYLYLPDPNIAAHEVGEGVAEYTGWIDQTSWNSLMNREKDMNDYVFNARYLKEIDARSRLAHDYKGRDPKKGTKRRTSTNNPVDVVWMYIDIIPKDWELGDGEYPEKWLFGVAGDKVLIAAQPLGLDHSQIPVVCAAPDFDGFSPTPPSKMGIISDLQNIVDFLYNSHIQNVKKAINNQWIVDPYLVNIHDVNDPKPGKIIRMRRAAWGRGDIDAAMKQFDVQDVTRGHIADGQQLTNIANQATGANDVAQGRPPDRTSRISSNEIEGLRNATLSRMEKTARVIDAQAHRDIAYMFASNAQQLMEQSTWVKALGKWQETLEQKYGRQVQEDRLSVSPLDIVVDYDIKGHTGTVPGSEDANTWVELFSIMASNPGLAQGFEMQNIFMHIAHHMGAKNIEDFIKQGVQPQVMDDQQVQEQARQGNLQPVNGQQNGS